VTMRMIERLDPPLHIDEVRKGLPDSGWTIVREDEDYYVGDDRPGVESGSYRTLVAEAQGKVAFTDSLTKTGSCR
jgi:hypothetical protein